MRQIERRVSMLLQLCCVLDRTAPGYRYVWKFTSLLQMALDIAYAMCRQVLNETCTSTEELADTLRRHGVITGEGVSAIYTISELLSALTRLAGPDLMRFIYENKDRALSSVMILSQQLINYIDKSRRLTT